MISLKARAEALGRTESELRSEMAEALGRIGRTLTEAIQDMQRLQIQFDAAPLSQRSRTIAAYQKARSRALEYYWYLIVQREAIGIRNHDSLRELYPIPEKDLG